MTTKALSTLLFDVLPTRRSLHMGSTDVLLVLCSPPFLQSLPTRATLVWAGNEVFPGVL